MPRGPQPGQIPKLTPEQKAKRRGVLGRLIKYVGSRYKFQLIAVIICIFLAVIANARGTAFMQELIDGYIIPMVDSGSKDFGPLAGAIGQLIVFYAIGILATFAYNYIMIFVAQGTLRDLRNEMFDDMEDLPIRYFDSHAHGDIMSIYTNDIDTLRQMISQSFPQMFNSAITIVTVFVYMCMLSVPLTGVTLVMIAIIIYATKVLAGTSGRYFRQQQQALGAVNGNIEETMKGQKVVKVFCHENEVIDKFNELNEGLYENAYKANRLANTLGPINAQLGNVNYVLCAIVGGTLAINGWTGLTLGALVSFLQFTRSFIMPIMQVSQQFQSIVLAMAGAERIFDLIDQEPEADEGYVMLVNAKDVDGQPVECEEHTGKWAWKHYHKAEGTTTYQWLTGDIVFDDVDFAYNPDKTVLHNIKLFATPGQKIAFVGATGAGKTTITNLINRFYDIADGKIRYDGININKIKKADLRKSLGIVLQDTHLFTGTIADNIRYGKLEATDEEVVAAAKLANADGFIRRLPQGYDTVISGDGGNLSQGQRQLLAIARAAIADPPVLILDEATSSIDTRTEKIVQDGMDKLMHGRTTFVIAHRLSTIRNSDCIMVLDQGRIIERGSHEELIKEGGKYYQLYTGKIQNA
ncbi:ATP-binding cassette, subfamily B [Pseudobutyrivibrio sp. ACV-2]|uniref:ABC transporter ATP-binding protein n=1 Tax=Pseudobutyrivibrio sp. ACV-2 TaxID=1520801 RepID=UPI00089D396F|nr:ABC transporter ATP-binding protein [Pseudobutyrivibrio sp. ACV-2]SEA97835.1 ATP-binding cassette, subfamily B [Pseudobutyrivibrio sp. ACV-2]